MELRHGPCCLLAQATEGQATPQEEQLDQKGELDELNTDTCPVHLSPLVPLPLSRAIFLPQFRFSIPTSKLLAKLETSLFQDVV